jgi:hypothetical protein
MATIASHAGLSDTLEIVPVESQVVWGLTASRYLPWMPLEMLCVSADQCPNACTVNAVIG